MGWFSSLFKKKAELQKAYIDITELQEWYDSKSENLIEALHESIKEDLNSINQQISKVKQASKILEEARLRNDKIPERAIQIMEGNRKAYINAALNFVNSIQTPASINFNTVSEFVSDFEDNIAMFTKSSARNFHVLQEFFAHESGGIAKGIKDIDYTIRGLLDNEYKKVNAITGNIKKINEMLKKKETADIMLSDMETERLELSQEMEKLREGMEELKKTKDYRLLSETRKKKDELAKETKDVEKRMFELFSPLERPMKKYTKIAVEGENLLNAYIESPMKAVLEDKELKIISLLEKLKSAVEKDELGLKDKSKEKALKQCGLVKAESLRDAIVEYSTLKEQYAEKDRSLKMNVAISRQSEIEYRLSHLQEKLSKLDANIDKLRKFIEMKDIDEIVSSVRDGIRDVLDVDLRIRAGNKFIGAKVLKKEGMENEDAQEAV